MNDERFAHALDPGGRAQLRHRVVLEHAVWAIQQAGFDAVISPRFGDIFRNNSTKNGLVPVVVPRRARHPPARRDRGRPVAGARRRRRAPGRSRCRPSASSEPFPLDDSVRHRFLEGLDDVGITLGNEADITAFEAGRPAWMPTATG